jgi:hypothetical protein
VLFEPEVVAEIRHGHRKLRIVIASQISSEDRAS